MNRVPPTRVLSSNPLIFKRVLPWLCGVVLAISAVLPFITVPISDAIFVAGIGCFGMLISRMVGRQFADEVRDGGDYLRVRDGHVQEDIPLIEIESVKEPILMGRRLARIELVLNAPGKLGRAIAFIPIESSLIPFQKSALTRELEERVERARRESQRRA